MSGFKRFLGVLEYFISKTKIIIQFGHLKMRADLKCLNLAFNEFTFYKDVKGDNLRPPREGFLEKDHSRHKTISLWRQLCRSQIPMKDFMSIHFIY